MYDVAIIGGGLAGLVNGILLKKAGLSVILFEEKSYPFHRVCGEYISNEVIPFLKVHDLFPAELEPAIISKFHLTSVSGKSLKMDLDLGGFGISRYAFDAWLAKKAMATGVDIHEKERALDFRFENDTFELETSKGIYTARVLIGSFGKRTKLDKELGRKFIQKSSPYLGVKYHVSTSLVEDDIIELHNFSGGYCGISRVENNTYNLCYLSHRSNLKAHKEISQMEEAVLFRNPFLKRIFSESEFLFGKPEVINEISFKRKEPVFNHMLMSGDSAGMITPLCGNGMAMAIHSSKILSTLIKGYFGNELNRDQLENAYVSEWSKNFAARHWAGRKIQSLFGSAAASEFGVGLGRTIKPVAKYLMSKTHGRPF
ncbi:MAG: NAD(P)/FAD-dependent oxidoreductase [Cyclobacteriaceae bacterium]